MGARRDVLFAPIQKFWCGGNHCAQVALRDAEEFSTDLLRPIEDESGVESLVSRFYLHLIVGHL